MSIKLLYVKAICLLILVSSLLLTSCGGTLKNYYSNKENYISATGTLDFINYNEETNILYLGFSGLYPSFDDTTFKVVGKNTSIVLENGFKKKVFLGMEITFISAPKYYGDGYVMPIVSLSINDEELLNFNEGFQNFNEWLSQAK